MKNLRTHLLLAGTFLCSLFAQSQTNRPPVNEPDYNKPHLFDALPARIPITTAELNNVLDAPVGKATTLTLKTDNPVAFSGEVVSVSDKMDANVQSVVLRSTNFEGARLTISRIRNEDGTLSFTGRIISFKHGDLFELRNESGSYVLVKRNFYDLVNE